MSLKSIMTPNPRCIGPDSNMVDAAELMRELDIGMLPVCEQHRLVGTVTDRDLVVRGVAQGADPRQTLVRHVMTPDLVYGREDQSIDDACRIMEQRQIRRLPVLDENQRLVGIVSLGDVAVRTRSEIRAGQALEQISEPSPS